MNEQEQPEVWQEGFGGVMFSDRGSAMLDGKILRTSFFQNYFFYRVPVAEKKIVYRRLVQDLYKAFNPSVTGKNLHFTFLDGNKKNCALNNIKHIPPKTPEQIKIAKNEAVKRYQRKNNLMKDFVEKKVVEKIKINPAPLIDRVKTEHQIFSEFNPIQQDLSAYNQEPAVMAKRIRRSLGTSHKFHGEPPHPLDVTLTKLVEKNGEIIKNYQEEIASLKKENNLLKRYMSQQEVASALTQINAS